MHVLVLTIGALGLIAAASVEFTEEWKNWKLHHGKTYESEKTEEERKAIWLANKLYIDEHNANAFELGYTLSMNAFGDLVIHFSSVLYEMSLRYSFALLQIIIKVDTWLSLSTDS